MEGHHDRRLGAGARPLSLYGAPVQTAHYGVIMEAMAKSWTDERLEERFDAIDRRFDSVDRQFEVVARQFEAVDHRFDRVDADFRELRSEMNARFERVDARFDRMEARFDSLQRTMLQFGGAMIVALVAGFVGIATQL